jgi:hypothetical protein
VAVDCSIVRLITRNMPGMERTVPDYEHCHLQDVANIHMAFSYCINHIVESTNLICKCLTATDGTAGASVIKDVGLGASKC